MEQVIEPANLNRAYARVMANKGAPGVDGLTVGKLGGWIGRRKQALIASLLDGSYQPQPVRGVQIPKPGGTGMRQLGIPTVVDRLVQQAMLQVLEPILDPTFSASSYGFRPGRGAHDALARAREYVADGRGIVVDIDLEKFFDRVNHDILMARLGRWVGDKRMLKIIGRFLRAGLMRDGVCLSREEGTPQGGPLSPLLANLLLDDLDKGAGLGDCPATELEKRGHAFCRYADDCNIYVQSRAAGERAAGERDRVPRREASLACEPGQERGGARRGTQVPGLSPAARRTAGDRTPVARTRQGASSATHPTQPGREHRTGDRRDQRVPDRVGGLLPLRGV
jgi:RNA-directed DNA polymerase